MNTYTGIFIERVANSSQNNLATYYELLAIEQGNLIRMEESGAEVFKYTGFDKLVSDNHKKYREWELEEYRSLAQKIANNPFENIWKEELCSSIRRDMADMDSNANPEKGRPLSQDVFKEEIKSLNIDIDYPFDSSKLYLLRDITVKKGKEDAWSDENCEYVYNGRKQLLKAKFDLLKSGEKQLKLAIASPWTFYVRKIGVEEYSYQLLAVLIMIFSGSLILEERKNRSNKLIEILPEKRGYIIRHYYKLALISVMGILIIVFILPMLYFGFKYGFSGLKNPIFVYEPGFTSFTGYTHGEIYSYYGLGKFYPTGKWFDGGFFPATVLKLYPLWKVLLLSFGLSILKIIFFTILGVGIGLSFSNIIRSSFVLTIVSVLYLVSQRFSDKLKFNPFSITSSWDVATGSATYTWFKSVVVLIVSTIIVHSMFYIVNEKRDYIG